MHTHRVQRSWQQLGLKGHVFGLQVLQEPVGPTGAVPEGRSERWGHTPGYSERRERSDGQSKTEVTCWAMSPCCPTSAAPGD